MIYLDLSRLRTWMGPPVGIIRTNLECARWLLRNASSSAGFCGFDASAGTLFRIRDSEVRAIIDRLDAAKPPSPVAPRPDPKPISRWRLWAWRSKQRLIASVGSLASASSDLAARIKAKPARGAGTAVSGVESLALHADDVYVSVGADWDVGQLPLIRKLKEQVPFKVALMCYDAIPIKYPHLCQDRVAQVFPKYLTDLAMAADLVLCISAATQQDFRNAVGSLGCPVPRTRVITLGANAPSVADQIPEDLPPELERTPYILYVSTVERRKNHDILYKSYVRLRERGVSTLPLMVFVGMRAWKVSELLQDIESDPRVRGDFRILRRVAEPSLGWLYRHCLFTVFPSLYEGWGLPVYESLAFGKFCISSDRGALPEVGGDLVEYLDPWDTPAWTEALRKYSSEPERLRERESRIRAQFALRTWEQFGETFFRELEALAASSHQSEPFDAAAGVGVLTGSGRP